MTKQKPVLPIIALTLAAILWGSNTTFIKLSVASIPVPLFMSIRFLAASLVILPFAIKTWKPLQMKDLLLVSLASIMYITLSALALNIGLTKTTATNAAIIWLLDPLILLVLSASFLRERLTLKTFLGIIVALTGALIIIGKPWDTGGSLLGNLLIVLSVFCNVIFTIISKSLTKKTSTYQLTFLGLFIGVIPIAAYALIKLPATNFDVITARSWGWVACSTLAVLLANFFFFYGLRHRQVQQTGVYQYVDCLATFLTAWWLLAERPSSLFIIGAVLVFIGVYVVEFSKPKAKSKSGMVP